jgi:Mn2+/Fe2+ NRAMP family transporter
LPNAKKFLDLTLGIVTSVGGFLEIGSIATSAQAGALYTHRLLWAVALGGLCLIFLVEMAGRFAAVSKHTIPDAMRERFGFKLFVAPLIGLVLVGVMVLAAELGGAAIAIELATGIDRRIWVVPVVFVAWLLLWRGTFAVIEKGVALLALVSVCFLVAAIVLHPPLREVAAGLVPRGADHQPARYWFLAVAILGASISPFLFLFYSAGAVEDGWNRSQLGINRIVSGVGMSFGTILAGAVLVLGALVLHPRGLDAQSYRQLPELLRPAFGRWGAPLFIASLGIACFGAALEVALGLAYLLAQGFGWNWGEDQRPREDARFCLVYTVALLLAAVLVAAGTDVLGLTNLSMALTSATLPLSIVPFLVLMNDRRYLGAHRNGPVGNVVVVGVVALALVLALVTIPLEVAGG